MTRPRAPACMLALALLPGCLVVGGSARVGAPLLPEAVACIVPGRTTKGELLALLGPPTEFKRPELGSALVDDELRLAGVLATSRRAQHALTWQHDRVAAAGTALLLVNTLSVTRATDLLVVFLDEREVVSAVAFRPAEAAP